MIKFALKGGDPSAASADAAVQEEHIAPVPRISIQAFCASADTAAAMQAASEDRRMTKAHLKIQMGGIAAATEAYRSSATPNVVIIESDGRGEELLGGLDMLAEVCDAGTRVIAIGHLNDIVLYREMVRRGVSDYLIAPVGPVDLIRAVSGLFHAVDAKPVGRTLAVVGAKGGVGASTVAHNIAWAIARDVHLDAVVADLDLPFGTAGLDFNQDPPQGIADAVMSPDRIDTAFVDRLLSKCTDHLSLLAAPATLDKVYDFGAESFDSIFDVLRATVPCIVLDVPHVWTGWARRTLIGADDILIVAAPDLANLRNTKNLIDLLQRGAAERLAARNTASTWSACRSGPRSRPPTSPRRWNSSRSRRSRSSRGVRHRGQQRTDDRRGVVRASRGGNVPLARADAHRPHRGEALARRAC